MQSLKIFCMAAVIILSTKGWYKLTDGFKVSKIIQTPQIFSSWHEQEESEVNDKVHLILKQPFYYLGRGQQCYAFESEDGNYVIKFLRLHKYHTPFWCALLPHHRLINHRNKSWDYTMKSLNIAWEDLKEESALIYLHIKKTNDLPMITIYDRLNRKSILDSNGLFFVVQKKAKPIAHEIKDWKEEKIKHFIDQYMQTISSRIAKNIRNKNRRVIKNLGWIGDKVVEFDVGEFRKHPTPYTPEERKKEAIKSTKKLRAYLKTHHPEKVFYLDKCIEKSYL